MEITEQGYNLSRMHRFVCDMNEWPPPSPFWCFLYTHTGEKVRLLAEIFKLEERTTVWKVRPSLRFLVNSESQGHHQGRMGVPASGGLRQVPCQLQHRPNPPWKRRREPDCSRGQWGTANHKITLRTNRNPRRPLVFQFRDCAVRGAPVTVCVWREARERGRKRNTTASISSLRLATQTCFRVTRNDVTRVSKSPIMMILNQQQPQNWPACCMLNLSPKS